MSFGFAVGDFIAGITFITDVITALNSTSGSVSEVKSLVELLKSLEQVITISKGFYEHLDSHSPNPQDVPIAKALYNASRDQISKCKEALDSCNASLKTYTSTLVEGQGTKIVKQYKKVAWLWKKDELISLESKLKSHLEALNMYNVLISCLRTYDHGQIATQLLVGMTQMLSEMALVKSDVASISKSITSQLKPNIPMGLGYLWETEAGLQSTVTFHDAIGRSVLLPTSLLNSPEVLDKERIIEENNESTKAITVAGEANEEEESDDEGNDEEIITKGFQDTTLNPLESKRKRNKHRTIEDDSLFRRVQYHREILISTSKTSTKFTSEESQKYDVNDLPPLHEAAAKGQLIEVDRLLDEGCDIESRLPFNAYFEYPNGYTFYFQGSTPLHIACWHGEKKVLLRLLERGAALNAPDWLGSRAVNYAVAGGNSEKVWVTLKNKGAELRFTDSRGYTLLHGASLASSAWLVDWLLEEKVIENPNARTIDGRTPIMFAAYVGAEACFEIMMDHGASLTPDVDINGNTLLHYAAWGNSKRITDLILTAGCDYSSANTDGATPLHFACWGGSFEIASILLKSGANPMDNDKRGNTALHFASAVGHVNIVNLLIAASSSIDSLNQQGMTPLTYAVSCGYPEIASILLEAGASVFISENDGEGILHNAARCGNVEIAKMCLAHNAPLNLRNNLGESPLHVAAVNGHTDILKLLLQLNELDLEARDGDGDTALHLACIFGHFATIEYLVGIGADVHSRNSDGKTVLLSSLRDPKIDVVRFLIENGADVDTRDNEGYSPLIYAVAVDDKATVEWLIAHGADVNTKDNNGTTPISFATFLGDKAMVELLLKSGADINIQDKDGWTTLNCAVTLQRETILDFLLTAGADITIRANNGRSLIGYAALQGNINIIWRLLDSGARVEEVDREWWIKHHEAWEFTNKTFWDNLNKTKEFFFGPAEEQLEDIQQRHGRAVEPVGVS